MEAFQLLQELDINLLDGIHLQMEEDKLYLLPKLKQKVIIKLYAQWNSPESDDENNNSQDDKTDNESNDNNNDNNGFDNDNNTENNQDDDTITSSPQTGSIAFIIVSIVGFAH